MAAIISGSIAVIVAILFLGWLTISINEIPLWIVIAGSVIMMLVDFIGDMRKGGNQNASH